MPPLKLYYLAAEVTPFSETYQLAPFSRKLTNRLHLKKDVAKILTRINKKK